MSFRIVPVPVSVAERVRGARADGHGNIDLSPVVADERPGFPCRICLRDAEVGERMLLFSYAPFGKAAPYQTLGPIYVHAEPCRPHAEGGIPDVLRVRLLALRGYDERDRLQECDLVDGVA